MTIAKVESHVFVTVVDLSVNGIRYTLDTFKFHSVFQITVFSGSTSFFSLDF